MSDTKRRSTGADIHRVVNRATKRSQPRTAVVTFGSNYYFSLSSSNKKEEGDGDTDVPFWGDSSNALPLSVACSAQSTVVLTPKGVVYQIGTLHGFVRSKWTRVEIPLPLKCVQVAAGRHFCLARMEGGKAVVAWGAGHFGQLGIQQQRHSELSSGDSDATTGTPVALTLQPILIDRLLPSFTGSTVESIAAGDWHGLALTKSGQVWAWGLNRSLQCGLPHPNMGSTSSVSRSTTPGMLSLPLPIPGIPPMKYIAAGRSHSCALTVDGGRVYCWGSSHLGQCGTGVTSKRSVVGLVPGPVAGLPASLEMVHIAAAGNHCLCVSKAGRVFGWGDGQEGQLGVSTTSTLTNAKDDNPQSALHEFHCNKPRLLVDLDFVAVAASQLHQQQKSGMANTTASMASTTSSVAETLSSVPKITNVYAAPTYSAAVSSSGHLYCWGNNDVGQLGLGIPPHLHCPHPTDDSNRVSHPPLTSKAGIGDDETDDDTDDNVLYSDDDDSTQESRCPTRPMHIRTFDSNHNVLLPLRVSAVDHMLVAGIAAGPNHMLCFGTVRSKRETTIVGRTLYEVQDDPPIQRGLPRIIDSGSRTSSMESETESNNGDSPEQQQFDADVAVTPDGLACSYEKRNEVGCLLQTFDDIALLKETIVTNDGVVKRENSLQQADKERSGTMNKGTTTTESKLSPTFDMVVSSTTAMDKDRRATDLDTEPSASTVETKQRRGILKCISETFLPRQWSWKSDRSLNAATRKLPARSKSTVTSLRS